MNAVPREAFEPTCWLLIFNHEASTWWRSFLAFGRFKHVWACAYVPTARAWLVYDVHLDGTRLGLVPDGEPFRNVMGHLGTANATIMRMPVLRRTKPASPLILFRRLGFWCVPAIAHLVGLECVVCLPDALYRACLRHGATPFEDAHVTEVPASAA